MVEAPWPTIVVPALAVRTSRLSQSLPTPKSHELGFVVGRLIDGSPAVAGPLLVTAVAAPASVACAPVKPTTVMCPTAPNRETALTVRDARAAGTNAHQISESPDCALACAARVQLSAVPLLGVLLTFWRRFS